MKIALITDTHWGVRNDHQAFLDANKLFLDTVFFPILNRDGIRTVIHLGDVVDRRKYVNINTAKRLREDFLSVMEGMSLDVHLIAGNHDTYFKNTNEVNALRELVSKEYKFKIYDKAPEEVVFDGCPILFIPWICDQNIHETMEKINATGCQIAMGHLEIQGFEMYKGSGASHGYDRKIFDRFDCVMSGHFHHRSSDGHIFYLGSHAEFTWSDYNDPKGFHIFDTETRSLTFIENPYIMFKKYHYDDVDKDVSSITDFDTSMYKNTHVKLIVRNKTNPYWFDMVVDKMEKAGVLDLQVVDDHFHLDTVEDNDIVDQAEDTLTITKKYVNNMKFDADKDRVNEIMSELYNEAMSSE